jgi:glycosyltransferase involved in cell wall biosynthesis
MFRIGYKLSSMFNTHIVFMIHQFLPRKHFLSRKKMRRVKIVTVSQALREYLVNTVKLEKEQISVLRNGLDLTAFPPRQDKADQFTLTAGMCDSYLPGRGHECFLQASKLLIDKGRDACFFICGYGKGEERIKKIARNLKISEHVTFVYEFRDIRKVMSLYDVFVLPSKREGLGYRALEAMAMGIPVIASSVGGLMDVVIYE